MCKLDLVDTRIALDECTVTPTPEGLITPMSAGIGGLITGVILGLLIGGITK